MMKTKHKTVGLLVALVMLAAGCATQQQINSSTLPASSSPSAVNSATAVPVTLPVLNALFSDEVFKTKLKTQVELSDEQLAQLQKIAGDEVARLRQSNTEGSAADQAGQVDQSTAAEEARQRATTAIRGIIGEQKAEALFALARDYWAAGNAGLTDKPTAPEDMITAGPNGIPKDTRVVVNIPAFRMDVFKDGSLVKSYKIGIGYPAFPLPTGLRKAEAIIFNPTWTPPDEPWVAGMKNVSVGKQVAAGSKLNPLGPIKIPIGLPSLIHGGKAPAKIGTFASHGCVGLTNEQVEDFSKTLAQAAGSELTDATIKSYFANRARTRVVKLDRAVPVELRYETIVIESGKLHVYRDVYNQDTNTEANLRAVLAVNGVKLEDLSEDERFQMLDAVNAMSRHPPKTAMTKPASTQTRISVAATSPIAEKVDNQVAVAPIKKPTAKNQREIVVELPALNGKGYPESMNLDTGSGKPEPAVALAKDH